MQYVHAHNTCVPPAFVAEAVRLARVVNTRMPLEIGAAERANKKIYRTTIV